MRRELLAPDFDAFILVFIVTVVNFKTTSNTWGSTSGGQNGGVFNFHSENYSASPLYNAIVSSIAGYKKDKKISPIQQMARKNEKNNGKASVAVTVATTGGKWLARLGRILAATPNPIAMAYGYGAQAVGYTLQA